MMYSILFSIHIFLLRSNLGGIVFMPDISSKWIRFNSKLLGIRSPKELLSIKALVVDDGNVFPNNEYEQALDMLQDIRYFFDKNKIKSPGTHLCRIYFSDKREYICFICDLNIDKVQQLKNIKIYGFFGRYSINAQDTPDYFFMEIGIKLDCGNIPVEIKTINAGRCKRRGRGSLGIRFLEDEIIPAINKILVVHGYSEPVGYIYGISADLSDDTNALARAKFYSKNGFIISNSHFYKFISY